jgi:methyl-accepting chemotaxis protein WspA
VYIRERRGDLSTIGRTPSLMEATRQLVELRRREPADSPALAEASRRARSAIESYADTYGYRNTLLFDPDGNTLFRFLPDLDPGPNLTTGSLRDSELAEAFDRVRTLLQVDLSDYQVYPGRSEPMAFIVGPVYDPRGRIVGYIALELGNREVFQTVADDNGLGATGETLVASRDGDEMWFIAPSRREGSLAGARLRIGSDKAAAMDRAVRGQRGYGMVTDYRGAPVMAAWSYLPSYRWGLVVKQDVEEAFALTRRQSLIVAVLLAATVVVVIGVALLVARTISRPIREAALKHPARPACSCRRSAR